MSFPRMSWHIGDYKKDTGHLNAEGHGAYFLLCMHYWSTGGLPDDDKQLARIACLTDKQWKYWKPILQGFFRSGWKHKRIEKELASAQAKYEARATAGKRGGEAKAKNLANDKQTPSNATAKSYQPITDNLEEERKEERAAADAAPDARTQLFTEGLASLHRQTGRSEKSLRSLVGQWLRDVEDDAVLVRRTIEDAERNRVSDAVAWITRALKPKARSPTSQTRRDENRQNWNDALEQLGRYASTPTSSDVREEVVRFLPSARSGRPSSGSSGGG